MTDYSHPALQAFINRNYESAISLGLLTLAEAGVVEAQEMAGNCYQLGLGTPIDMSQAATWYERAIANGSGLAANNLAGIVSRGYDQVPPDYDRSIQLLQQARKLGFEHAPVKHYNQ